VYVSAPSVNPLEPIAIGLSADEPLMRHGLVEWWGPANCTDELAVAMGFADRKNFFAEIDRLLPLLDAEVPLTRFDWARALLATEIVFASTLMGAASEWNAVTDLTDAETLLLLREVQRKLVRATKPLIGSAMEPAQLVAGRTRQR
jgi:hypothetical protein